VPALEENRPKMVVTVQVSYNKEKLDVPCELSGTVMSLKESLAVPSGVKANHQKLIFKGKTLLNDEMLDLLGIKEGSKLMLMVTEEHRKALVLTTSLTELSDKVSTMAATIDSIDWSAELAELRKLDEQCTQLMLKLDALDVSGEYRQQRKEQIVKLQRATGRLEELLTRQRSPL